MMKSTAGAGKDYEAKERDNFVFCSLEPNLVESGSGSL